MKETLKTGNRVYFDGNSLRIDFLSLVIEFFCIGAGYQ
ncbi:hypothetical protein cce_3585 [Crocosphaera subtropica ATCC 51142]|uniref:Uncharacterized protein n=1 Tax=Crocosphaera subtropica (strain ATCC 51142 / BH68) TaxID=43989 RepID=B1X0P4_CROS5|nr:hypothetical protein cce_3585 [Crocosphaera subtropica ATCC 51142]